MELTPLDFKENLIRRVPKYFALAHILSIADLLNDLYLSVLVNLTTSLH